MLLSDVQWTAFRPEFGADVDEIIALERERLSGSETKSLVRPWSCETATLLTTSTKTPCKAKVLRYSRTSTHDFATLWVST